MILYRFAYPSITLKLPRGVIKIGGANEYAEKFNISPTATEFKEKKCIRSKKPLLKCTYPDIYLLLYQPTKSNSLNNDVYHLLQRHLCCS